MIFEKSIFATAPFLNSWGYCTHCSESSGLLRRGIFNEYDNSVWSSIRKCTCNVVYYYPITSESGIDVCLATFPNTVNP